MAEVPQAEEGVDQQVERVDFPVGYAELSKPELREIPAEELLEGYEPVGDGEHSYNTEAAFTELAKEIAKGEASVIASSTLFLWNERTGEVLRQRQYGAVPRWHALALREAGYQRYIASTEPIGGGIISDGFDSPGEVVDHYNVWVREDHTFAWEADYLVAQDRLSEPFTEALAGMPDEEFCRAVLDSINQKTAVNRDFEAFVLRRPSAPSDEASTTVRIGSEGDDTPDVLRQLAEVEGLPDQLEALKGPFAELPVSGDEIGLCKHRGPIPSIPELAGSEWAVIQMGNRYSGQEEFMEKVAARIGHGARVHVEGVSGQVKVLVPVAFGFAGA